MTSRRALLLAAALVASPADAQTSNGCGPARTEVPAAFANWSNPTPFRGEALVLARSVSVPLTRNARFAVAPSKAAKPNSYGAAVPLKVNAAGDYDVALSEGAWLDLIRNGAPQASTAHRHGPACSTMRKIVTFHLMPGVYSLEISNGDATQVEVEVVGAGADARD